MVVDAAHRALRDAADGLTHALVRVRVGAMTVGHDAGGRRGGPVALPRALLLERLRRADVLERDVGDAAETAALGLARPWVWLLSGLGGGGGRGKPFEGGSSVEAAERAGTAALKAMGTKHQ